MVFATEATDRWDRDAMSSWAEKKVVGVTFTEQTPKIRIGQPICDPLYEKAFLTPRAEPDHEYDRNTATWD